MSDYQLEPFDVLTLSLRQTFRRLYFWVRLSAWRLFFSVLIVTWPAATAGFYYAVGEGIRDPEETYVNLRDSFLTGFRQNLLRSTGIAVLNLIILVVLLQGVLFWALQEEFRLNLIAGVGLPFLIYWWMCQPLIFPILVAEPELTIFQVMRRVIRVVNENLLFTFTISFVLIFVQLLVLLLTGPGTLIGMPFIALMATQAYWNIAGIEIPDLIDPVLYAEKVAKRRKKAGHHEP